MLQIAVSVLPGVNYGVSPGDAYRVYAAQLSPIDPADTTMYKAMSGYVESLLWSDNDTYSYAGKNSFVAATCPGY